jgi:hypothetical protein
VETRAGDSKRLVGGGDTSGLSSEVSGRIAHSVEICPPEHQSRARSAPRAQVEGRARKAVTATRPSSASVSARSPLPSPLRFRCSGFAGPPLLPSDATLPAAPVAQWIEQRLPAPRCPPSRDPSDPGPGAPCPGGVSGASAEPCPGLEPSTLLTTEVLPARLRSSNKRRRFARPLLERREPRLSEGRRMYQV